MKEREQRGKKSSPDPISPELKQFLEEEAFEAEIEAAQDAALEEGMIITREEAVKLIVEKSKKVCNPSP